MTIEELKNNIINKDFIKSCMIFKSKDKFLPNMYIKEIATIKGLEISYIQTLDLFKSIDIFGTLTIDENKLYVYNCDSLNENIDTTSNLIVVTDKVSDDIDCIVFPQIEEWQIKDYLFSVCDGIPQEDLEWMLLTCKKDIYRIQNELDKFLIFSKEERVHLFNQCKKDNMFGDTSDKNIFDFISAIRDKNMSMIEYIYCNLQSIDIEPLGVVTLLYKDIKRALMVKTMTNPRASDIGLKNDRQIYAIKKSYSNYTINQLINIFKMLCSIDFMLKDGTLPSELILDYVVSHILTI